MRSYDSLLQDAGGNLCDMHDIRYRLERLIDLARQDGATRQWVDLTYDDVETAKRCLPRYISEITEEDLDELIETVIAAFKEKNK